MRDSDVFIWRCFWFQNTFSDNAVRFPFRKPICKHQEEMNHPGKSVHSPCFIYTDPVNSVASELGRSPDHYLSIHWAVSQSYLNKCPLVNLWLCSSSLVRSQTLQSEISSAAVYAIWMQRCSDFAPQILLLITESSCRDHIIYKHIYEKWLSMTHLSLVLCDICEVMIWDCILTSKITKSSLSGKNANRWR